MILYICWYYHKGEYSIYSKRNRQRVKQCAYCLFAWKKITSKWTYTEWSQWLMVWLDGQMYEV